MIDTWTEMESCRAGQRLHHHRVRITEYFTEFWVPSRGLSPPSESHDGVKMIPRQESAEIQSLAPPCGQRVTHSHMSDMWPPRTHESSSSDLLRLPNYDLWTLIAKQWCHYQTLSCVSNWLVFVAHNKKCYVGLMTLPRANVSELS